MNLAKIKKHSPKFVALGVVAMCAVATNAAFADVDTTYRDRVVLQSTSVAVVSDYVDGLSRPHDPSFSAIIDCGKGTMFTQSGAVEWLKGDVVKTPDGLCSDGFINNDMQTSPELIFHAVIGTDT